MPSLFKRKQRPGAKRADTNLAMEQVLHARKPRIIPRFSQLIQLPRFLTAREQALAGLALLTIFITGALLGLQLFNTKRVSVPSIGGEYTEGLMGIPQLINPLYALSNDVDNDLTHLIYSGLLRFDSEDGLVPDLAQSYEVTENDMIYTIRLREDARWHDGKPVTVNDLIFTFSALQNPDYRSPLQVSFSGVGIEQVDEKTIRFVLSEPFAPFLSLLTVGILPAHLWQDIAPYNAALAPLNQKPIGSGPYEFAKLTKDAKGAVRSYELTRNQNYHLEPANIEKLTFKFYSDSASAVEALRNQNVEGLGYLPPEEVKSFADHAQNRLLFPTLSQYTGAFFNQNRNAALKDKAVRTALSHATNKQALIEIALSGLGETTDSFILKGMIGEYPDIKTYPYDQEAARASLENAGWKIPENGSVRQKDGTDLAIEIVAVGTPEFVKTAEALKTQWEAIGVSVSVRTVTQAQLQNEILRDRAYDVLLSGELYGIDPDPYAFWHSSQIAYPGLNLAQLSNRKADELIETGRKTSDREKRAEIYRELQSIVAEEVSAIFLYQPSYTYITSKKVQGIEVSHIISPADRFSRVNKWYIKTKKVFATKNRAEEVILEETEEIKTEDEIVQ